MKLDSWDDANGQKRSKHSIVADLVVFLSSGAVVEVSQEFEQADQSGLNPANPAEKELMNQIQQIKTRQKTANQFEPAKAPAKKKEVKIDAMPNTGEVEFVDEPPFQDDLPF